MANVAHRTQTGLNAAHPPYYNSESDPTTTLGPYRVWRKPSTGVIKIRNAANTAWDDISIEGTSAGSAPSLADLSDVDVISTPPGDGEALVWDDTAGEWVPGSVAAGSVDAADVAYAGGTGMSATNVETAIDELATEKANDSALTAHIDDTADAHDAQAISYAGGTGMSATHVEGAIDELATEKANDAALTAHIGDTSDAHDASAISYLGSTNLAATEVEAALDELDTEKAPAARTISTTAPLTGGGDLSANRTLAVSAASESASGVAEIATQGETDTGTDDGRIVTPLKAATRFLAKAGGTLTGFLTLHADPSSAMHAVTKQYADGLVSGGASPADETTAGIAEVATQGETDAGTDDGRIVTPLKLANYSGLGGGSIEAWHTVGGGGEPALQNSWTGTMKYRKDGDGLVTIQAAIASGTTTATTVIVTMPSGYRIAAAFDGLVFPCESRSGSGVVFSNAPIQVMASGDVRIPNNGGVSNNSLQMSIRYYID